MTCETHTRVGYSSNFAEIYFFFLIKGILLEVTRDSAAEFSLSLLLTEPHTNPEYVSQFGISTEFHQKPFGILEDFCQS